MPLIAPAPSGAVRVLLKKITQEDNLQEHGGHHQSQWHGETVPRGLLGSLLLLQLLAGE